MRSGGPIQHMSIGGKLCGNQISGPAPLRLRDGVKVDNLTHWISTHRWHAPPEMCYLPFGLKRRWHNALRPLVEQWIGNVELEDTDLYGLRRYTRGSTLMPHVDREETHAASVIVNIGQYGMDEAWPLQIYDLHSGAVSYTHLTLPTIYSV